MATMAQVLLDVVYSLGNCLSCFPGSPTLKINSRSFKILRLLGEGGFSYVYLVQDTASHQLLALKKIRCPFGAESVQQAMREVDAYRLFAHVPSIIAAVDHAVATERGAAHDASKTVYVLLPYYRRGNLQDMINANLVNNARFPERQLLLLFLGVCRALRAMHRYRPAPAETMAMGSEDDQLADGAAAAADDDDDDGPEQERPLMRPDAASVQAYAHRDIKPGNIMIDDAGTAPILMDLGSVAPSPVAVSSQSLALQIQDAAAEHSTMPYRAPELFDVRTGSVIDTKTDIWSLGCTLYACLVGKSPFEMRSDETGGTLSLCVLGGDWRFPDEPPAAAAAASASAAPRRGNTIGRAKARAAAAAAASPSDPPDHADADADADAATRLPISQPVRDIVRCCLKVEPAERPDIDQLIAMVERALDHLSDADGYASSWSAPVSLFI